MKTILNILRGCATDAELMACIFGLVVGYVFIAILFWQIHWMAGVMSVYMTTDLIKASMYIVKWCESHCKEEDEKEF